MPRIIQQGVKVNREKQASKAFLMKVEELHLTPKPLIVQRERLFRKDEVNIAHKLMDSRYGEAVSASLTNL